MTNEEYQEPTDPRGWWIEWRDFTESRAWNDPDPRVWKLWCYLKGRASHCTRRVGPDTLEPGELRTSPAALAANCNPEGQRHDHIIDGLKQLTRKFVRYTIEKKLIPWGYVRARPSANRQGTIVTIVHWRRKQAQGPGRGQDGAYLGPSKGLLGAYLGPHTTIPNSECRMPSGGERASTVPTPKKPPPKSQEPEPNRTWDEMVPLKRGRFIRPPTCPKCGKPLAYWEARSGSRYPDDRWYCDQRSDGCGARYPEIEWEDPGNGERLRRKGAADPARQPAEPDNSALERMRQLEEDRRRHPEKYRPPKETP